MGNSRKHGWTSDVLMKELKTANSTGYWTGILGTFGVAQYSKANNTYVAVAVIPLIYG